MNCRNKALGAMAIGVSLVCALPVLADSTRVCHDVGGSFMTNLGTVNQYTTLGTVTGDLRGAVAATIVSVSANPDGTTTFVVQHHVVTDDGETLYFDQATALTRPLSQTLYAVLSYPVHISGGTGKYAHATGDFSNIGEVDLATGRAIFRYTGNICMNASIN